CVRPQHDPPFGLVAEAVVARAVDHLLVARTVGAGPVADAVVTGEVRRGLGRSDEVVAGHAVADGPRKRALSDVRPELLGERQRPADGLRDAWFDPLRLVQLLWDSDAHALERVAFGKADGLGQLGGRRVARIAPGDDRVEKRSVPNCLRDRSDLVEARGEGDDAVARDGSVRRTQAHVPAQSRRLLDGAARVRAERPWGHPCCDSGRRASAGAAGDPLWIPRIARRAEGRVLRRRSHRELVGARLPEQRQPCRLDARRHCRVEDGHVPGEDLRAGRRLDSFRRDDVLERDRDAPAARVVRCAQEAAELAVALGDRPSVGLAQLRARDLAALEETLRVLRGQTKGVDYCSHAGTLNWFASTAGALAKTSASSSDSRGTSSSQTFTRSRGCAVGATSPSSSSETMPTASRIFPRSEVSRSTSSSDSASRASRATWSTSSREIGIRSILSKFR